MGSTIAYEAQRIVREAAEPVPAGETIKGQLRRACRALGYPDGDWRIKSAWYGEADPWSAKAFEELRARYSAWKARQEAKAAVDAKTAAVLFASIADRLGDDGDARLDREMVDRLRQLASRLGGRSDGV